MSAPDTSTSDVILAIQDPYMGQIVDGTETYEFRKYRMQPSVKRIWFYRTAPHSSITHVCEVLPARTRNEGDVRLEEDGIGNSEFNARHEDWEGCGYAYGIVSVYELRKPIGLEELGTRYGIKMAPRGRIYLPEQIVKDVPWDQQILVLDRRSVDTVRQQSCCVGGER